MFKDETGKTYGRLQVIERAGTNGKRSVRWLCKCDCGNIAIINGDNLRNGSTKSCGCIAREIIAKRNVANSGKNHPNYGKRGSETPAWKNGRKETNGYIKLFAPNHHHSDVSGYVFEHILVMESMLGRHLQDQETVHHCDGNKANNLPYNLRLFINNGDHTRYHTKRRRDLGLPWNWWRKKGKRIEVKEVKDGQ